VVEFASWVPVAVIGLFAVVGFAGVVATSALTVVRSLRHRHVPVEGEAQAPHYFSAA
jgi:hypothetical protein